MTRLSPLLLVGILLSCASTPPGPTTLGQVEVLDRARQPWSPLLHHAGPTLVVFATVWCEACAKEWPRVREHVRARPGMRVVYVVSGSPEDKVRLLAQQWGVDSSEVAVVVDTGGQVADHYKVRRTPTLFRAANNLVAGPFLDLDDLLAKTSKERVAVEDQGEELGTTYHVVVVTRPAEVERVRAELAEVRAAVRAYELQLSEWLPDSEISRVNAKGYEERVAISGPLREIIEGALHVRRATGGAFDPTWASLAPVWEGALSWPDTVDLDAVGDDKVSVDDKGVRLLHPDTQLGIAGIAKGWIIDQVHAALRAKGHEDIIVNIGGDVRTSGRDQGGAVRSFRIVDPYMSKRISAEIALENTALATSGNYLRKRTIDGRPVGHVLDPRTGYPPAFDGSVTVLTRDAAMADALATALFVMGPDAGLNYASARQGVHAIYVTKDGVRSTLPGR